MNECNTALLGVRRIVQSEIQIPTRNARRMTAACLFAESLQHDGWLTPNADAAHYAQFPRSSGVYLFLKVGLCVTSDFGQYKVLYVGKSKNLYQRQQGHEIFRMILGACAVGDYIQRWFKPLDERLICDEEIRLIKRFNPPYNIIHRVRGL